MADDTEWTDRYRLGIPSVDREHHTFFTLLHGIETSLLEEDGAGAHEALRRLRRYAEEHFTHEEAFLETMAYPDLARHKAEHAEFMRDVTVLEATPDLPPDVAVRLARTWLGRHIQGTDRRYARWLESPGRARALPPKLG